MQPASTPRIPTAFQAVSADILRFRDLPKPPPKASTPLLERFTASLGFQRSPEAQDSKAIHELESAAVRLTVADQRLMRHMAIAQAVSEHFGGDTALHRVLEPVSQSLRDRACAFLKLDTPDFSRVSVGELELGLKALGDATEAAIEAAQAANDAVSNGKLPAGKPLNAAQAHGVGYALVRLLSGKAKGDAPNTLANLMRRVQEDIALRVEAQDDEALTPEALAELVRDVLARAKGGIPQDRKSADLVEQMFASGALDAPDASDEEDASVRLVGAPAFVPASGRSSVQAQAAATPASSSPSHGTAMPPTAADTAGR